MSKYIVHNFLSIANDFVPETFGRLTTIGPKFMLPIGRQGKRVAYQVCECSCGKSNAVIVRCCSLVTEMTQSCGCLKIENTSKKHTTHGKSRTSEHNIWKSMRRRCSNPRCSGYLDYGGRGIRVCPEWDGPNGFERFISDMGYKPSPKHSIDRYPDKNGNYEPGNCRWATNTEQCRNQRSNHMLTAFGKTLCISQWAEELGIDHRLIRNRIRRGWSHEEALAIPVLQFGQKHNK